MPPPTRSELERIAGALVTQEGLVEKDWHVVRALAVLAAIELDGGTRFVFCGGTSLSRGWGLLSRFSEDIDFRVWSERGEPERPLRRKLRSAAQDALAGAGFVQRGEPTTRDGTRYVEMTFDYGGQNPVPGGLRDHLKVELTMTLPRLQPVVRPVQSFVCQARRDEPEVSGIPCVDPVETAAEKLSGLAWRGLARDRGLASDDPAIVRHLYDLAALQAHVSQDARFDDLVRRFVQDDAGRGGGGRPTEPKLLFRQLVERLEGDPLWEQEYSRYIHEVTYGRGQVIPYAGALDALRSFARRFD